VGGEKLRAAKERRFGEDTEGAAGKRGEIDSAAGGKGEGNEGRKGATLSSGCQRGAQWKKSPPEKKLDPKFPLPAGEKARFFLEKKKV